MALSGRKATEAEPTVGPSAFAKFAALPLGHQRRDHV